jgi:thiamine-monophosphate kinase
LSENDEFALIRRLTAPHQSVMLQKALGVVVGIGDDAAVVEINPEFQLVMSCDTMVQDVHFNEKTMSMTDVGFKALASALSDLAAMGASGRYALVALTIPKGADLTHAELIYEGLYACAAKYGIAVAGGDTTSAGAGGWVISVTVAGEVEAGEALLRSSARPGDAVFITGALGCSAAGLDYLLSDQVIYREKDAELSAAFERLAQKHRRPLPQIRAGRVLLASRVCHALNDISDGLSSEAWEIAEASEVGIILEADLIPIDADVQMYAEISGKTALDWVLYGGEDYQLVGTVPMEQLAFLKQAFMQKNLTLYVIGEVTDQQIGVQLRRKDHTITIVPKKGYNHLA